MARITVQDCLEHVNSRFKLVLLATKRARKIANGAEPLVDWNDDKPTVVALREIAEGKMNHEIYDKMEHQEAVAAAEEEAASEVAQAEGLD